MEQIEVVNPATEDVIGTPHRETEADADRAVREARDAFRNFTIKEPYPYSKDAPKKT